MTNEKSDFERYAAATHAMQSGVMLDHEQGSNDGSPKHLRVGINSAMINDAALIRLLTSKGIITTEEYTKEVADEMEREVKRYEDRLSRSTGVKVILA